MVIEPLAAHHERAGFDCGVDAMNHYLRQYARQNDAKGISRTYIGVESPGDAAIVGYYTLAASSVQFENLPVRQLPHYPIPMILLARLAVGLSHQGQGVGRELLFNALSRCQQVAGEIGVLGVEVVALNDNARRFYFQHGFSALADDPLHLYITLKTIRQIGL